MHRHPSPLRRIAVAVAGVTIVASLTGCSLVRDVLGQAPQPERDGETQEIIEEGQADVFAIRVGDCADTPDSAIVTEIPVVPCSEPHDDEVYHEIVLDDGDYPGDETIERLASEGCLGAFDAFVGVSYESSELDVFPYRPTAESWEQGDRLVSCMIYDVAGPVTGSLKGAQR